MALYLRCEDGRDIEWHIGQAIHWLAPGDVQQVQADGDELEWILDKFENIPASKARVITWPQPWAGFIAANCT